MRRGLLGRLVLRSARGPINLSVIGVAAVAAAALSSWPVLAIGGAAYAALVALDLSNPGFRRQVMTGQLEAPRKLSGADAIRDPDMRSAAGSVRTALQEVAKVLAATPERVRRHVETSLDAIAELERHAALLVERGEALSGYLASVDAGALRAETEALDGRARATTDAQVRDQYQKAHAAAGEQLRALADIATSRERILANLSRIAVTLHAVPAQLMRMRALDDQATDTLSGTVGGELDRMNIELKAFEQTLEDLQEVQLS